MPSPATRDTLIRTAVTPRFEVFYALQALESRAGEHLTEWRHEMDRRLPPRLRTSLVTVAPTPLVWPLLADALRELPATVTYREMIESLRGMNEPSFQRFVLGGVFKSPHAVDRLVSGGASLARTVAEEAKTQEKLLGLLGLHPFDRTTPAAIVFQRIVKSPGAYRDEVTGVLESFWDSGFSETWRQLEPEMRVRAREMRRRARPDSFDELTREHKLPITIEGDDVVTMRGATRYSLKSTSGIYLVPSAFNTARLWAAYADARGRTRFFIPVLYADLLQSAVSTMDPASVFRALGDTTRYAIASTIARTPMTSVELARAFSVSKPTISHHVQVMRSAGLLEETHTDSGVQLGLNRRMLERLSSATAREMFSDDETRPVVKRSRRKNK